MSSANKAEVVGRPSTLKIVKTAFLATRIYPFLRDAVSFEKLGPIEPLIIRLASCLGSPRGPASSIGFASHIAFPEGESEEELNAGLSCQQ